MKEWLRIFRRRYWDAERARELESHLELETARNVERGMPSQQAARAARLKPGNATLIREEIAGRQTLQPRFNMALFSFFAMLGVALAAGGVFSVISYHIARRTHEIGVRIALGARQADIAGLVVGMGAKLVCAGLVTGLIGTLALVRTVQTQVFDLSLFDLSSASVVIALLVAVALLACYVPARRAARVDPTLALRQE